MNEIDRYRILDEKIQELKNEKIRIEERLNAKKGRLKELVAEIEEKGYDYKNLTAIKEKKREELNIILSELEKKVKEVSDKLNSIEI